MKEDLFEILTTKGALATLCETMSEMELCVNLNATSCEYCPISSKENLKKALEL